MAVAFQGAASLPLSLVVWRLAPRLQFLGLSCARFGRGSQVAVGAAALGTVGAAGAWEVAEGGRRRAGGGEGDGGGGRGGG